MQERMVMLMPTDSADSSSVTQGTVRWRHDDAYAQAFGNKPEYASRVRQVGPNIWLVRGSIRSYHTPSQPHSQNQGQAVFPQEMFASEMERALEVERARHASEMERALEAERARQASEIERVLEAEWARHKLQMDEVLAAQSQIMSHFSQMESLWRQSVSVPGVSHDNIVPDKNSAHHMNVSSVDSRSGNN
jgi:hypothetical protein